MAYSATVIPVMIASPSDVQEEREIIRSAIHDWNDVNSSSTNVILTSLGWETHSSPELGERPQELINKRILKDCDLLIGVFWTRFGTPTGKSSSGTAEEIEEHVRAGKPAMLYFSSRPAAPETIDKEQHNQVLAFRDKWEKQGLIERYDTSEEFRSKLSKQLAICLSKNEYLQNQIGADSLQPQIEISTPSTARAEYALSNEALTLLKTAAEEGDGTIMNIAYLAGREIQAGKKVFCEGSGRDAAKWEGALQELVDEDLVVERGYKGEIFELTHKGWELADAL